MQPCPCPCPCPCVPCVCVCVCVCVCATNTNTNTNTHAHTVTGARTHAVPEPHPSAKLSPVSTAKRRAEGCARGVGACGAMRSLARSLACLLQVRRAAAWVQGRDAGHAAYARPQHVPHQLRPHRRPRQAPRGRRSVSSNAHSPPTHAPLHAVNPSRKFRIFACVMSLPWAPQARDNDRVASVTLLRPHTGIIIVLFDARVPWPA